MVMKLSHCLNQLVSFLNNEKELSDSNLNQIALIFLDNNYITVADYREMLPNRCHDNRLITAFGVFTPYFLGRLLFPLNSCGGLGRDVVAYTVDILDLVYYAAGAYLQHLIGNA